MIKDSKKINVLVLGGGGREHAICRHIKKSPALKTLYCLPGNGGTQNFATNVRDASLILKENFYKLVEFCKTNDIDFVIVGAEKLLDDGIIDVLEENSIIAFGPSKKASILESSKEFTKNMCAKIGVPSATYVCLTDKRYQCSLLKKATYPLVIKKDGLASGKGVFIVNNEQEGLSVINTLSENEKVVFEDFLIGREVSFFALCHHEKAECIGTAHDYKKLFDGEVGPNTGGMGSVSPSYFATPEWIEYILNVFIRPTLVFMKENGAPFKGILYAGLIQKEESTHLIEYNVRFGDPETQSILPCVEGDLLELLYNASIGIIDKPKLKKNFHSANVVLAAPGYPENPIREIPLNFSLKESYPNYFIEHAGTEDVNGLLRSSGGRIVSICASDRDISQLKESIYKKINSLIGDENSESPALHFRRDIGRDF